MPLTQEQVAGDVQRWLARAVIGLNLCPFAKAVVARDQVRLRVSEAEDANAVLQDLREELQLIASSDPALHDTTLLALPHALSDFLDFNDVAIKAERAVRKMGLEGVIQVASFHPRFQFEGTEPDDITNFTNRSPHPILHLLREESIDRAVRAFPDASAIYDANMRTMIDLGLEGWASLGVGPAP